MCGWCVSVCACACACPCVRESLLKIGVLRPAPSSAQAETLNCVSWSTSCLFVRSSLRDDAASFDLGGVGRAGEGALSFLSFCHLENQDAAVNGSLYDGEVFVHDIAFCARRRA